jgi:hypothetical protein
MIKSNNAVLHGAKILSDIIREIIFFPLWWYTKGLWRVLSGIKDLIRGEAQATGFFVWLKNIHKPMYGQYDWAGRLISFVVRFFQVIVRGIMLLIWIAISLALLVLWIALPLIVLYQIAFQMGII